MISAVDGTAGVGKTALAVHWAHRVRSRFPDGNLYADLRGHGPGVPADPARVLDAFLTALEMAPARIPTDLDAKVALYRSLLDERQMLVVLDNAASSGQVRPLLPGSPRCLIVVTSRDQLTGLAARDHARRLSLDVLPIEDAVALLATFVGPARAAAEPDAVRQLARLCARLPIALCVAGERAAAVGESPLDDHVRELAQGQRLDLLDAGGDPETAVRGVFSWSYGALTPDAARLFRLLGVPPGPDISIAAATALAGLPVPRAGALLVSLARAHLVDEHAPGRYRLHDLLRAYAAELSAGTDSNDERDAALRRVLDHYLHTAHAAARMLDPAREPIALRGPCPGADPVSIADHEQALAWFGAERAVLLSALDHANATAQDTYVWHLAWTLNDFLGRRGHWHDWAACGRAAVAAARRSADPAIQANAHRLLAYAYRRLTQFEDADDQLRQSLDLYRRSSDPAGQAHTHYTFAQMCAQQGAHTEALDHALQAGALYRIAGYRDGEARALSNVGWYHAQLGDHARAIEYCRQALTLLEELGDRDGQAGSWDSLGHAHHHLGDFGQAAHCYRQAVSLYVALGDCYYEADTLVNLGDAEQAAGHTAAADDAWRHALSILTELEHPDAAAIRARLGR